MRLDQEGSDIGRIRLDIARREVVVGRPYRFTVTYEVGPRGVESGGCLRFKLPGFRVDQFWGQVPVSCSNPAATLNCTNAVPAVDGKHGIEFFALDYLFVTIDGDSLREGATVAVVCGDTVVPQMVAPRVASQWPVEVATDLDGTRSAPGSGFYLVPDPPVIDFVADSATNLEVTIPSSTVAGEPFDAVVRARDQYMNSSTGYGGTVELGTDRELASGTLAHSFHAVEGGLHVFKGVVLRASGINRLHAADVAYGLYARSNPSKTTTSSSPAQLYWGDTHTHSSISADSAAANSLTPPAPAHVYVYARNVANLDFCMVTDHSENMNAEDWPETQEAARTAYEPGKFVTFSGFEATHQPLRQDGDKNVYFLTDDQTYISEGTAADVYKVLKGRKGGVMVIPHQHARTNWELHDPELERVVEVYAHWGCGLSADSEPPMIPGTKLLPEHYVSHALEQGVRTGFIASADHSGGRPGDDFWWGPNKLTGYTGGLAAVYAPSLTREGIWDGLWRRRCYATTRARILLEFEINGHTMGEEFTIVPGMPGERDVTINVSGTVPVKDVELIKNGRRIMSWPGRRALDLTLEYVDPAVERDTDYYYVHVGQEDGEQAWSSPIWATRAP